MSIYRQIYETHYGSIPLDETGRTYEIHHIDGNHENNDITNLKCVSLNDHYDIHYSQGDYGACALIAKRMKMSPEEISHLASIFNIKRVEDGTHPWTGPELNRKRLDNGTHNFLGGKDVRERVKNGTHNFLDGEISRKSNHNRVENGTHNFLGGEEVRKRVENGTHNFLNVEAARTRAHNRIKIGNHPFLISHTCPHCSKVGKGAAMFRYHFEKCKFK